MARVALDYPVKAQSPGFGPATQGGSMTNVTTLLGVKNLWKAGYTGDGIDVAVIDTGVAPISSLNASDKVVVGPDLSFESQSANAQFLDSYGHGTAMAGIIAGREVAKGSGAGYAADNTSFYGMAPDARIISLKLADRGPVDQPPVGTQLSHAQHARARTEQRLAGTCHGRAGPGARSRAVRPQRTSWAPGSARSSPASC